MATDPYWGCIFAGINLAVPPASCKRLYYSNPTLKIRESLNVFAVLGIAMCGTFVYRQIHRKYLS